MKVKALFYVSWTRHYQTYHCWTIRRVILDQKTEVKASSISLLPHTVASHVPLRRPKAEHEGNSPRPPPYMSPTHAIMMKYTVTQYGGSIIMTIMVSGHWPWGASQPDCPTPEKGDTSTWAFAWTPEGGKPDIISQVGEHAFGTRGIPSHLSMDLQLPNPSMLEKGPCKAGENTERI